MESLDSIMLLIWLLDKGLVGIQRLLPLSPRNLPFCQFAPSDNLSLIRCLDLCAKIE